MPAIISPPGSRARPRPLSCLAVLRPICRLTRPVEAGQGLVEYALILVLIAIVSIGALTLVGRQTSDVFAEVNCSLSGGSRHSDSGNGNSDRCVDARGNNGGGGGGGGGGQP